jgi:hypothetical protein
MREIKPEELIQTLLDGAPGEDFEFIKTLPSGERVKTRYRLQVLRVDENHQALRAAQEYAKTLGEHKDYGDLYREAQAVELLAIAMRHTEKRDRPDGTSYYPRVFVTSKQLRDSFNESEMSVLLNCYQIAKSKHSSSQGLEEEEAETWIARLSDPLQGPFHLSQLDSLHWPGCILLLAGIARDLCQAAGVPLSISQATLESDQPSSPTDTGSSTGQPSASSIQDPTTELGPAFILTKEQAREILEKRKRKPDQG